MAHFFHFGRHDDHSSKQHPRFLLHLLEGLVAFMLVAGVYEIGFRADDCLMQSHHGCVLK